MATTTRAAMVTSTRSYIQDSNTTTSTAFTDAQVTAFINTALLWWYENTEKRIKTVTLIATLAADTYSTNGDATFLYPEVLEVSLGTGTNVRTVLSRLGWSELRLRQERDAVSTTPTHYALLKTGGGAVSASAQNKWLISFYPLPSAGFTVYGIVRDYPVQLSADADIVDLGEFEARCVEIIAAILAAPRMGRAELAQDLMGLLPKLIQDKLDTHRSSDEVVA